MMSLASSEMVFHSFSKKSYLASATCLGPGSGLGLGLG